MALKIIPILVGILFCAALTCQCEGSEDDAKPVELNRENELPDWLKADAETDKETAPQPPGLMRQFLYGIAIVAVLGMGIFYFSKKLMPKLSMGGGKSVSVVETIHLGQNKTLHVIKIAKQKNLLISCTKENINLLADITEIMTDSPIQG